MVIYEFFAVYLGFKRRKHSYSLTLLMLDFLQMGTLLSLQECNLPRKFGKEKLCMLYSFWPMCYPFLIDYRWGIFVSITSDLFIIHMSYRRNSNVLYPCELHCLHMCIFT